MLQANRRVRRGLIGVVGVSIAVASLGACGGGTTASTTPSNQSATTSTASSGATTTTSPAPSTSTSTTTTAPPPTTTTTVVRTTTTAVAVRAGAFAAQAGQVVTDLAAGRFAAVTAQFDPLMASQLSTPALEAAWTSYQQVLGPYQSQATPVSTTAGDLDVEQVPVTMANGRGQVRVTVHADGTIAGLYLLNAGA